MFKSKEPNLPSEIENGHVRKVTCMDSITSMNEHHSYNRDHNIEKRGDEFQILLVRFTNELT